jgi:hypothetical protein
MAYKKYARECDECGKGMNEGYLIDNGYKYYCSDECLHKNMTPEEWLELYNDGDGDSCWTTWDEDPDEYMVDEDDPAPNKLSVDLRDTLDVDVGFNTVKAVRLLAKQLRDQGLDPDKYEFINWTVTCDVQVKEEDKA